MRTRQRPFSLRPSSMTIFEVSKGEVVHPDDAALNEDDDEGKSGVEKEADDGPAETDMKPAICCPVAKENPAV